jgi:hypothetical protein
MRAVTGASRLRVPGAKVQKVQVQKIAILTCTFFVFQWVMIFAHLGQVSKGADASVRNLHLHLLHLPCLSMR